MKLFVAGVLAWLWAQVPARWVPGIYRVMVVAAKGLPAPLSQRGLAFFRRLSAQGTIERDYTTWISLYEQTDTQACQAAQAHLAGFEAPPTFSVVMPVFNPSPDHLRAAIRSVQAQFYPHWELCIADDASTNPEIGRLLRQEQADDPRIKIVLRDQNGHISAASNSALGLATGTFIALLDHDDLLSPRALYEVASRIEAQPDIDIVYSDEDHIDDSGRRSMPYFKPDWNPELMLGQNLINHLGVYRRSLVQRLGGFRVGLEGSQDYDLALRVVAETTPGRIVHIPGVLYHWRRGSTIRAFSEAALDRCTTNARRAVQEFVSRAQPDVQVEPAPSVAAWNRVIYPVPQPEPLVSVIIPSRDHADMLARTVQGLLDRTHYPALEVLIVDNGSTEPDALALLDALALDPRVRVLRCPGPFNYSALNNGAVREAAGSLILLLNNDIDVIDPDWLREMVSHAIRPGVGAVGAKLLFPDGTIQHGGVTIGMGGVAGHQYLHKPGNDPGYFGHLKLTRNVTAVTAACLLVRRQAFLEVGGFDEVALPVAFNDVDLCLKLVEKGYRNLWTPFAELFHLESASRGSDLTGEKAARFNQECLYMQQRWGHLLDNDPYCNPNLSLLAADAALAFPPRVAPGPERKAA